MRIETYKILLNTAVNLSYNCVLIQNDDDAAEEEKLEATVDQNDKVDEESDMQQQDSTDEKSESAKKDTGKIASLHYIRLLRFLMFCL